MWLFELQGGPGVPASLAPWSFHLKTPLPNRVLLIPFKYRRVADSRSPRCQVYRVPVDRVPIGDDSESSPRHRRALSAENRRGPSPYPITPGNTSRRDSRRHRASSPSTKAKAQALALIPPPAYACEISNPRPAGVPVSFAPGDGHRMCTYTSITSRFDRKCTCTGLIRQPTLKP